MNVNLYAPPVHTFTVTLTPDELTALNKEFFKRAYIAGVADYRTINGLIALLLDAKG